LLKEVGVESITDFRIENDRIYFLDYKKMKIGILDYQSLRLVDLITIAHQKDAWQIGNLEVKDKKIYVMEYLENNNKNLHIYLDDKLV